jgi:SAM-dependent methyltransferase
MHSEFYTKSFYEQMRDGSMRSAEAIVPLILQLLTVRSVVDVGCGDGTWLAVFRSLGVEDIQGLDGDYIDQDLLQVPPEYFKVADLTKPFRLERTFDLVISLEVGEHLPAESATAFVESLTKLAPLVLFSAAIPGQGGNHHINEQWPDKWAKLFREHNYVPVDFIRKRIWQSDAVEFWYVQNTLLFARLDVVESSSSLKAEFELTNPSQLSLVHPRQYAHVQGRLAESLARPLIPRPSGIKEASRLLLLCVKNSVKKRLGLR